MNDDIQKFGAVYSRDIVDVNLYIMEIYIFYEREK